jgi:hypothetical protein
MSFEQEKTDLLNSLEPTTENTCLEPKRGSKDDLISKIHECCDKHDIICEYSTTQLKRSTKKKLAEILAGVIERCMEKKIRDQIKVKSIEGATPEQNEKLVAVGTLRLLHDSLARATEVGVHRFSPYTISGFTQSMAEERVSEQIDACLLEIAEEYSEVLDYISSPYVKLALIWSTSAASTARRKPHSNNNVRIRNMESRQNAEKETLDSRFSRRQTPGKVSHANLSVKTI